MLAQSFDEIQKTESLNSTIVSCLNVWIGNNLAPKASNLMCIVDLHDVKLLDNLSVNTELLLLEQWHHLLSKVDGYDIKEDAKGINLFVDLKYNKKGC
jgi:hypothetical protein